MMGLGRPAVRRIWQCCDRQLILGEKTLIMGILNVTPDSFSGDGLGHDLAQGLKRAEAMLADGADIFDIGGESTRPGSEAVSAEEELRRVIPLIKALAGKFPIPISIDTTKAEVAAAALENGAVIINDITALAEDNMPPLAAKTGAGVVLMHMQGTPRNMQKSPHYADVIGEIRGFLQTAAQKAEAAGIKKSQIVLDPGIGFGKTLEHNLEIFRRLEEFTTLGYPLLVGTSRKALIGKILGTEAPDRLEGTAATVALAIAGGADIVRVHDVKEMARVAKMTDAIVRVKD
jgi:dihydropteroate synthase